ncbi:MAG TPA: 2-phospho-L-lactate guanylyltransferase [Marmoricola sp.]|nr:2-phospho-L-lactate guanylyltransferase [Marmoricola sp.]
MFAVLVPLKRPDRAKTRLAESGVAEHQRLAVAFAWDTIAAATASPLVAGVWVVTDAPELVPDGAHHLADEGEGDLNLALSRAAEALHRTQPSLGIAALCGDLPALITDDLTDALAASDRRSFVVDAAGTGTSLVVAAAGAELAPAFGLDSAMRHAESGAKALTDALVTLRLDVDTADDLERAIAVGVGLNTQAALADG